MSRFFGLFVLCVTVILLWPAAIIIPNQSITLVISFVLSSDIDYINSLYPDAIIITAGDFNHDTSFLDVDHGLVQMIRFSSVVQTGSASPVLTATGLVNGRWQFLTPPPTESTPLNQSPKHLVHEITSVAPADVPNLVKIRQWASG